jgi:hypothetical protein
MQEHRDGTASILTALGRIPATATPAEINAAVDQAIADGEVDALSTELLYRLGAGDIYHPAAA